MKRTETRPSWTNLVIIGDRTTWSDHVELYKNGNSDLSLNSPSSGRYGEAGGHFLF